MAGHPAAPNACTKPPSGNVACSLALQCLANHAHRRGVDESSMRTTTSSRRNQATTISSQEDARDRAHVEDCGTSEVLVEHEMPS
eukprot:CAMPEP_0119410162 /NCGR_PEP_ID=MMETSP1335-20130426/3258_1 /TAXON_ID=259385 /ORGANISM="Chrysoculter rhomboideus, Strain RCC1486" /LENGTH=84 /DNA_ID=CAMNT_0007434647 /DNA_START=65 /DNA_END=319 /DNA_ORIENTATION=+